MINTYSLRKLQNQNICIDSIENIWEKSLVPNQFSLTVGYRTIAKVDDCTTKLDGKRALNRIRNHINIPFP